MKLTPAAARALEPGRVLKDHEVTGLQLHAGSRSKSWRLYYRTRAGDERRPTIGKFPDMSLSRAREVARDLKERIAKGEDPSADWQTARNAPTVTQLCDRYLDEHAKLKNSPRWAHEAELIINRHIKPGLGARRVADVTRADIDRFLIGVRERKYVPAEVKARDGKRTAPGAANMARAVLWKMFTLAEDEFEWRPRDSNPVRGTNRNPKIKRKRVASADEIRRLAKQLREIEAKRPGHAACLWTIFLTGARVSEILHATGEQLRGNRIVLTKHKTVRHVGDKEIIIPRVAMQILERLPVAAAGEPLWGYCYRGKVALKKIWATLRKEAQLGDLQVRDARRTFASFAVSSGVTLEQVGQLFAHTHVETTRGYAWLFDSAKERIADSVAQQIMDAANGTQTLSRLPASPAGLSTFARVRRRAARGGLPGAS